MSMMFNLEGETRLTEIVYDRVVTTNGVPKVGYVLKVTESSNPMEVGEYLVQLDSELVGITPDYFVACYTVDNHCKYIDPDKVGN